MTHAIGFSLKDDAGHVLQVPEQEHLAEDIRGIIGEAGGYVVFQGNGRSIMRLDGGADEINIPAGCIMFEAQLNHTDQGQVRRATLRRRLGEIARQYGQTTMSLTLGNTVYCNADGTAHQGDPPRPTHAGSDGQDD